MAGLVARDAVMKPGAVVAGKQMACEVPRLPRGSACVVFRNPAQLNRSNFLGLLAPNALQDNSSAAVETLIDSEQVSISESQPIVEILKHFRNDAVEHLPVFDARGGFIGVLSQRSIMEALMRRERELLRKTREFRQTSQDDKARRYESTRRLEQTNQAFRKLLSALARPESMDSFKHALEALIVVADAGWGQIAFSDEQGRVTQRILASHPTHESFPPNFHAENLMIRVISENRILSKTGIHVTTEDSGHSAQGARQKQAAFLGLPLAMDDRRFGCVYLWDKISTRGFNDDDEILLSSLSHAISITLAHARDLVRRRRLEFELDILASMAREAGGAGSVECVASILQTHTDSYWNWDAFSVGFSRAHGRRFQCVAQVDKAETRPANPGEGPPEELEQKPYEPFQDSPSEGLFSSTSDETSARIMRGEAVLINRQDLQNVEMMHAFGNVNRPSASMIFVPLHGGTRVNGIVSIHSYTRNKFTLNDVAILQRMADAVSPAFHRCLAETITKSFFLLTRRLAAAATPKEAGRIMVEIADDLIGWDSCSLHFYHADTHMHEQVLLIDTFDTGRVEFKDFNKTEPPGGLSLRSITDGPILYLRKEAKFDGAQVKPFGNVERPSASLMFAPLEMKDQVLGVLSVQSYTINAYDQDDLDLLKALADQCSGAIARIRGMK